MSLSINSESVRRTRYRLAEYSVHALTFILILVAIFAAFYERGDVLLLGLLILLVGYDFEYLAHVRYARTLMPYA